jgi:hypothetical protein
LNNQRNEEIKLIQMRRDLEARSDIKEKDTKINVLKDENKILKTTLSDANIQINNMDRKLDQKEIMIVSLQKEILEKDNKYENLVKIEKRKINFSEITCGENTSDSNFLSTLMRERSGADKKHNFNSSGNGGRRNNFRKNKAELDLSNVAGSDKKSTNIRNNNRINSSTTDYKNNMKNMKNMRNNTDEKSGRRDTDYAEESKSKISEDGEYNYNYNDISDDNNNNNYNNNSNSESECKNRNDDDDDNDSDFSENEKTKIEDFEKTENFKEELIRLLKEKEIEMKKSIDKIKGKKNKSAYIAKSKEFIYFQKIISMSKKIKNLKEKIIDRKYWKRVAMCVAEAAVHTCAEALSVPEITRDKDSKYKISSEISDNGVFAPLSTDNRIIEYLRSSTFNGNVLVNKKLLATVLEMSKVMYCTVRSDFYRTLHCILIRSFVS